MKRSIWLVLLIACVATWSMLALHRTAGVDVTTANVSQGSIVHLIVATGSLRAVNTVQVGAQISGTVESLNADFNSVVHAGQVLARLDPASYDATLNEARAALAQAEAAVMQARANELGLETAVEDSREKLTRAEELSAAQLVMRSDLDAARIAMSEANAGLASGHSQVSEAEAMVTQARSAVSEAKVNLDRTVITSPIDGIVVSRTVDLGQTLAATYQAPVLFAIATDLTRLQLEVDIDESDIAGVHQGEPVQFEVESYPNEQFSGTVSQVRLQPIAEQTVPAITPGAPADSASGVQVPTVISYAAIADVSNATERLRPGMTATVSLEGLHRDGVVRIPNQALAFRPTPQALNALGQKPESNLTAADLMTDPTARRVWEFDGSQFTPIDVRVGLADPQWTELREGALRPGDALVTVASIVTRR